MMNQSASAPAVTETNKRDDRGRPYNCGADVMHQKGLVHGQGFYQSIHAKPTKGEAQNLMSKVLNTTQQKSCGIGVYPNMT